MRIYLDNCCFNRPFDDQSQIRIRLETEAKLEIQERIRNRDVDLVWSYLLDFENQANPIISRRNAISRWRTFAVKNLLASEEIIGRALEFSNKGLRAKDSLHLACAIVGGCGFLITTDDELLRKSVSLDIIRVRNPMQWIVEVDE